MPQARVLLIEDTPAQAEETLKALSLAGYDVVWEQSGLSGLKRAKAEHPDLILLDLVLPDIGGQEVCRWLKHDNGTREIPIIMLTSQSAVEDRVRGLQMGADDYLPKPFNEMELAARIYAALRTKALQDELREKNQRLEALLQQVGQLAVTDSLTGLSNRRRFEERVAEELERSVRYQRSFSILMLDIDKFKKVNDTYGHPAGDTVLQAVARTLTKQFRSTDTVARYGGEEFAVILPETGGAHAKEVGEKIRKAVAGTSIRLPDEKEIGITLSIGIACFPACGGRIDELMERADQALYIAKQEGRDRVCLYRETLRAQLEKDPKRIAQMLNQNLDNIQPIVTAVDVKTDFSREHSVKVERYAVRLGKALGLPGDDLRALRLAGLLHDVGILLVPDDILTKQGALTSQEWKVIQQHPITGTDILREVQDLEGIVPLVRHHHEWYDGSGYPDGLEGEEIPFLARILAVADVYSALTSDRPQRKALTHADARDQITQEAGTHFDPDVVAAFQQVWEKEPSG